MTATAITRSNARFTKIILAITFMIALSPLWHTEAEAARAHGWVATAKVPLRSCHSHTCKRLIHIQEGQVVTVANYWDNWGYGYVGEGEISGWIDLSKFKRDARPDKMKRCYDTTFGYTVCAPDWISEAITHEAKRYKVPRNLLMQIAACESDFKPQTLGAAGEIGIFQWLPSTWNSPGVVGDIHDTWNQTTNAAKFISQGYAYWWTCWRRIVQGER